MILASGYNTDNEKAVNSILLYNYTVLYIAGEYFIVNAFNAASISQEHHSVEGLVINELIDKLATANANSIETEIANFITNDKLPVIATMSVAGIVKQAEAVNDATDDAIKTINELLANLRKAGILYETR